MAGGGGIRLFICSTRVLVLSLVFHPSTRQMVPASRKMMNEQTKIVKTTGDTVVLSSVTRIVTATGIRA
jgi:hypothetical protein